MEDYLTVTKDIYSKAASKPQVGLCCTTTPVWQLPGLTIPKKMLSMNYGCGTTVHPRDLVNTPKILYVGVGGGMELLQFAYFSRQPGAVTGVDVVAEMIKVCEENLIEASRENDWFTPEIVQLLEGDALQLPVADETIDVAAQNCLFNIFKGQEIKKALEEMFRVLRPHGKLVLSDPVCEQEMPEHLKNNSELRALCLTGALPLQQYMDLITSVGFGTVEVRARRPYRVLDSRRHNVDAPIYVESVEVCAIKDPMPQDGPCVFTGKTAIYFGEDEYFDDGKSHILMQNQPLAICDKTAANLASLNRKDIFISPSTWFYDGGGCC